jgi:phytoene dehydrogenase-like protein
MGEIDGKNNWYYVKGGMGSISQYLEKLAKERGVTIRTESQVEQLVTAGGKVTAIKLADGTELSAPIIISNTTHHVTFNNLIKNQDSIP